MKGSSEKEKIEKAVDKVVDKAVDKYNKYRSPEASVKLISTGKIGFKVEFTGPFCRTCGFHDYFDDFKIFLEDYGLKTNITHIEETDEGAVVKLETIFKFPTLNKTNGKNHGKVD